MLTPTPRCSNCRHYAEPGTFSSRCLLGHADWMHKAAPPIVRADNSCSRFEAMVEVPVLAGADERRAA